MPADYILVADFDEYPCVTHRKASLIETYPYLTDGRIFVVKFEIESWYLAGLDEDGCDSLALPHHVTTDTVTKEMFNQHIPTSFKSRVDFMVEILKRFKFDTAKSKNESFSYFAEKYLPTSG